MKGDPTERVRLTERLAWIGIGLGALFWVLESAIHAFLFHEGSFIQQIYSPSLHETWMRLVVVAMFIAFAGCTQHGIIKRKRSEEALRQSETLLRNTFEAIPDLLTVHDRDLRVVLSNWHGHDYVPDEKRAGQPHCYEAYMHRDKPCDPCHAFEVFETGKSKNLEKTNSADGITREINVYPVFDKAGKVIMVTEHVRDISERKRAEEALQESEVRYRTLFESANDAIFIMKDDVFTDCNESTLDMFGCTRDEIIGRHPYDLSPPTQPDGRESKEKALEKIGAAMKDQRQSFEWRHERCDGTAFDVEVSLNMVELREGILLQAIVRDITARKQAEEALWKSEQRLELALKGADLGLWDRNIQTGEVIRNERVAEIYGCSIDEMEPTVEFWESNIHPDDKPKVLEERNRHLKGATPAYEAEYRLRTKSGQWKWVLSRGKVVERDKDGNPLRIVGTHLDTTDRKKAEEALRESEEKARVLLNAPEDVIVLTDLKGTVLEVNEASARRFGKLREEMIGSNVFDLFPPELAERRKATRDEMVRSAKPVHIVDENMGDWFDTIVYPVLDSEGRVKRLAAFARNITERKRAEEALRESEKQLRALAVRLQEVEEVERKALARELHDQVGQTLTALNINLNIMRNQLDAESLGNVVARLDDSTHLLEDATQRIRDVMAELRPQVLDDYGLTAALRWYGERFEDRTGILTIMCGDEISIRLAEAAESALFRITQEALTNVAKHAEAGQVALQLEETDGRLRLIIADDGKGFDAGSLQRSKEEPGWGLLTMQERGQALGGQVHIESEPGKGTRVTVELEK